MANENKDVIRVEVALQANVGTTLRANQTGYAQDSRYWNYKTNGSTVRSYPDLTRLADQTTSYGTALIGTPGITGVTPSGGSSGAAATLQAMLSGLAGTGNSNFIHNGTSQQTASYNVSGTGRIATRLSVGSTLIADMPHVILNVSGAPSQLSGTSQVGLGLNMSGSSAATDYLYGVHISVSSENGSYTTSNAHGIWIGSIAPGSGATFTTIYGIKIEDQTAGGTDYAIYTGAGIVRFGGDLQSHAGRIVAGNTLSSPTTLSAANYFTLVTGTTTITLPAAASHPWRVFYVKNAGSNTVTIARTGSDTIDGSTSIGLVHVADAGGGHAAAAFVSDGANWFSYRMHYVEPS